MDMTTEKGAKCNLKKELDISPTAYPVSMIREGGAWLARPISPLFFCSFYFINFLYGFCYIFTFSFSLSILLISFTDFVIFLKSLSPCCFIDYICYN